MMQDIAARYQAIKDLVIERREEFTALMDFLEKETAWLTSPASTRFHLSREGGLLEHSVNVAETLLKLRAALLPSLSEESCAIVGLLHDLGKAGMPGNPQYLENQPTERQKQYGYKATYPFRFNEDLIYMSVPLRSLYMILPALPLYEDEAQAIMYHDGQYVDDNKSVATKETPLTLLLTYADGFSSFVIERN